MTSLQEFKTASFDRFTPLVAVVPTKEADDLCRRMYGVDIVAALSRWRCVSGLNRGVGGAFESRAVHPPVTSRRGDVARAESDVKDWQPNVSDTVHVHFFSCSAHPDSCRVPHPATRVEPSVLSRTGCDAG